MPFLIKNKIREIVEKLPASFLQSSIFPLDYYGGGLPQRISIPKEFKSENPISFNYKALFNTTGRGNVHLEEGYWDGIDKQNAQSIAGYVPYIPNETKLLIFNFFS